MEKNKKTIFGIIILIFIISILVLFSNYFIINLSPENTMDFCKDSDGNLNLIEQSKKSGYVLYIHKECDWNQINIPNATEDFCIWSLTYNDYCINSTILREQTCSDNIINSENIICSYDCLINKCK